EHVLLLVHVKGRSHVSFNAQNDASKLLLSLAKLEICKKLSSGVDSSVLKELDGDGVGWFDLSNVYGFLLNFVTGSHPKVRKIAVAGLSRRQQEFSC
ncbi:hypothetical protein Droror1_Dr00027370, partial [Drosera rotundifolia]